MADKGGKRKHFDVRPISDVEEVMEVSPVFKSVFNRLKKTKKETTSTKEKDHTKAPTTDVSKEPISLEIAKSKQQMGKDHNNLSRPPEPLGSSISGETNDILGLKPVSDKETVEQSELSDKGEKIHAGRNFMETFAFIEKTKHYEEPKVSNIASCSSSEVVPQSNSTQDVPPVKTSKPNAIIVNQRQKGNPVLKFFRHVPWEYGDVVPDYVMGPKMCALFLSTRYHNFNPNYIHDRLKKLGNRYELRVLLVQVDTKDPHKTLKELTKIAILADCTLILAWSAEEVARYIETYKIYENKPPESLQGQTSNDYLSKLTDCLTTVKSVNKTDAVTLLTTFGSLENIIAASVDEIALCPGFGPQKAKRLHGAFNQPFVASKKVTENDGGTSSKTEYVTWTMMKRNSNIRMTNLPVKFRHCPSDTS